MFFFFRNFRKLGLERLEREPEEPENRDDRDIPEGHEQVLVILIIIPGSYIHLDPDRNGSLNWAEGRSLIVEIF